MNKKLLLQIILILTVLNLVNSFNLLNIHFGEAPTICDFSEKFDCGAVNHGPYAKFLGFPVAGIGFFGLLLILIYAYACYDKKWGLDLPFRKKAPQVLFAFSLIGFLFQFYLTLMEAFVIHFYCIYCLISQTIIAIILVLSYLVMKK